MLNEDKEIERIMRDGFKNNEMNFRELRLVAKNYLWNFGYTKHKTEKMLNVFCMEHDKNFNEVKDKKILKSAIKGASKREIQGTKAIPVYKKELEAIETLKNFKVQKIAFVMLVLSKFYHKDGGKNYYFGLDGISEAIGISKMRLSKRMFNNYTGDMETAGLIESPIRGRKESNYVILKYVEEGGEIAFEVNTGEEYQIINRYISYYGGEIICCSSCGKPVIKKARNSRMCEECWREKRKADIRYNVAKFRKGV